MEFLGLAGVLVAFLAALCLFLLLILTFSWWVFPNQTLKKLKKCGLGGPTPSFPLGNIKEMKRKNNIQSSSVVQSSNLTHDIHSYVFPYFSSWQKSHGKPPMSYIHAFFFSRRSCSKHFRQILNLNSSISKKF